MHSIISIKNSKWLATIALCCIQAAVYAQQDWNLKRDEDGIKVYTASTANSNFKSVKVECVMAARLSQLVAFLMDVDKQKDWVYSGKAAQLIKRPAPNEIVFYAEIGVPWPATNRDYIAHITVSQKTPQLVTIDSHSEPDLLPVKDGKIRVRHSVAHWDVIAVSKEQLKVIYTVEFDPAGSVPAWLLNMFITKGPFETFQKLREEVAEPPFVNGHVDYVTD